MKAVEARQSLVLLNLKLKATVADADAKGVANKLKLQALQSKIGAERAATVADAESRAVVSKLQLDALESKIVAERAQNEKVTTLNQENQKIVAKYEAKEAALVAKEALLVAKHAAEKVNLKASMAAQVVLKDTILTERAEANAQAIKAEKYYAESIAKDTLVAHLTSTSTQITNSFLAHVNKLTTSTASRAPELEYSQGYGGHGGGYGGYGGNGGAGGYGGYGMQQGPPQGYGQLQLGQPSSPQVGFQPGMSSNQNGFQQGMLQNHGHAPPPAAEGPPPAPLQGGGQPPPPVKQWECVLCKCRHAGPASFCPGCGSRYEQPLPAL